MAEMKTRAAAALTAFGLACGGLAINDGSAGAAPTSASSKGSEVQTAARYKLVFSDNFNGRKLSKNWTFMDLRAPTRLCSLPDPRLHSVKNGKLKLEVRRNAAAKPNVTRACPDGQYLNGVVGTRGIKNFKYGKFSARIKFQAPKGAHGAFWLYNNVTEVDVAEYFGASSKGGGLASYVHRPQGNGKFLTSGGKLKPAAVKRIIGNHYVSEGYHTFTVVWTPSQYVFSIDGKTTLKVSSAIGKDPSFLVLSLLSSYYELPNLKKAKLPLAMRVDWVKVWQK